MLINIVHARPKQYYSIGVEVIAHNPCFFNIKRDYVYLYGPGETEYTALSPSDEL